MFKQYKKIAYEANLALKKYNLVILTWGNVSIITPDRKYVIIKPSGVSYETMQIDDMVVVDMQCNIIEGKLKPSSDLDSHIELYKNFTNINAIVHTHSTYATSWAQANKNIVTFGTTHADTFYGDIPCTRRLNKAEIENNYELNTAKVIVETFKNGYDYQACPGVLVANHGPFTWGEDAMQAVEHALILEQVAKNATLTMINSNYQVAEVQKYLKDKHYYRKHGKNAYYGQKK